MSVERVRSTLVILPLSLYIVSLGWLKNLLAATGVFTVLLPICALLYVYWVPLTLTPVRDTDGNPQFR